MKIDSINNVVEQKISNNDDLFPKPWGVSPGKSIRPQDEHIFYISLCDKHYRVIVDNKTDFTIKADCFIDEGVPVLVLKKEGGVEAPFLGLELKDQTIVVDDAFLRKYHM